MQTHIAIIMGIHSARRPMPSARKSLGLARWAYSCVREAVAIPLDAALLLFYKALAKV
jgi:hypothetical protein